MHEGMPKPQEQHRKLASLAGNWVGEEKMHPSPWDPKGGSALGKVNSRIDLDGFFLVSDYTQERGGQISYRGHGVVGYDPAKGQYTMHWFDSVGSPVYEPSTGKWQGNVLAFQMQGPMGHHRYVYTVEGEGRYFFKLEHSQDGKAWGTFMEGRYSRK
jgi:hypothetical protein